MDQEAERLMSAPFMPTAQNQFGTWQGTLVNPLYDIGPTASSLAPFSSRIDPGIPRPPTTPPASLTALLESQKIEPPPKPGKKSSRDRLTDALLNASQPAPQLPPIPPLPGWG